jgi:hypothetical protein
MLSLSLFLSLSLPLSLSLKFVVDIISYSVLFYNIILYYIILYYIIYIYIYAPIYICIHSWMALYTNKHNWLLLLEGQAKLNHAILLPKLILWRVTTIRGWFPKSNSHHSRIPVTMGSVMIKFIQIIYTVWILYILWIRTRLITRLLRIKNPT